MPTVAEAALSDRSWNPRQDGDGDLFRTSQPTTGAPTASCSESAKPVDAAFPIPQFGWVGRLAPKAGGRKATFDVDYCVDTGELVSVQVAGEGSVAKPILDALFSRLAGEAKPTELDTLKAEQARVTALKTICEAYAALKAEKPAVLYVAARSGAAMSCLTPLAEQSTHRSEPRSDADAVSVKRVIDYAHVRQCVSNWCWAACLAMVAEAKGGAAVSPCSIVQDELGVAGCCNDPNRNVCNQPLALDSMTLRLRMLRSD